MAAEIISARSFRGSQIVNLAGTVRTSALKDDSFVSLAVPTECLKVFHNGLRFPLF